MSTSNIRYYMYQVDAKGIMVDDSEKDLEYHFEGLKYSKATGFADKGKRKNVYTETYADSDELRVWLGDKVTREATEITFTFVFFGDNRYKTYQEFYEYVNNSRIVYYDTKRNKKVLLVLTEAIKPSTEMWYGKTPYIIADFKFQNLWGEAKDN